MLKDKPYYSPKEFAKITGLDIKTVYRWIKRGDIETLQKTKGAKHLIPQYELPTYKRKEQK